MKKLYRFIRIVFSSVLFSLSTLAADPLVGRWETIDDSTGKPRSIVKIEQINGEYQASVEKGFPRPGIPEKEFCDLCPGDKKGKPMIGLVFMWGLKGTAPDYSGGEVLDPDNGKVYKCKITLADDQKSLTIRGFIGISLFGRSQTWNKVSQEL